MSASPGRLTISTFEESIFPYQQGWASLMYILDVEMTTTCKSQTCRETLACMAVQLERSNLQANVK